MSAPVVEGHVCRESPDPRRAGWCACGRRLESAEPDPRTVFDPAFVREFLRGAERLAGLDVGWRERVEDRVQAMQEKYGSSYRVTPLRRLLSEIDCEGLDLGGWGSLIALRVNGLDLDEECALEARLLLQEVAAYGVRVASVVERLRELLSQ